MPESVQLHELMAAYHGFNPRDPEPEGVVPRQAVPADKELRRRLSVQLSAAALEVHADHAREGYRAAGQAAADALRSSRRRWP